METQRVRIIWDGPARDIVAVMIVPTPRPYGADIADLDPRIVLYRLLDAGEEATGEIVGIEIEDFLDFDRWDALPALAEPWQAQGRAPLPIADLFKHLQVEFRTEAWTPAPT